MDTMKWERLFEVQGRLEAELIESYLEANGVDVELIQEVRLVIPRFPSWWMDWGGFRFLYPRKRFWKHRSC